MSNEQVQSNIVQACGTAPQQDPSRLAPMTLRGLFARALHYEVTDGPALRAPSTHPFQGLGRDQDFHQHLLDVLREAHIVTSDDFMGED